MFGANPDFVPPPVGGINWFSNPWFQIFFFTARKRSLGQGNIFRSVCQEFCPQGGGCLLLGCVSAPSEGCMVQGGSAPGGCLLLGGCLVWGGSAPGGCLVWGVPGGDPPGRLLLWRYASYWNAFFSFVFCVWCFQLLLCNVQCFQLTLRIRFMHREYFYQNVIIGTWSEKNYGF